MWFSIVAVFIIILLSGITTYSLLVRHEAQQRLVALREAAEAQRLEDTAAVEAVKREAQQRLAALREAAEAQRLEDTAAVEVVKRDAQQRFVALREAAEAQRLEDAAAVDAARREVAKLERFRHIPDILEKAEQAKAQIAAKLDRAQNRAQEILESATRNAVETVERADAEARAVREDAQGVLISASEVANTVLEAAKKQAAEELSLARRELKESRQKAENILSRVTAEAVEIAERAEKKAAAVGGKAYEALKKKEFYESAAEAMRNVTKGYGDRYMISGTTILDELAEEYGFDEAGIRLQRARERVKVMEKNRTAATCDYAEMMRRELAINFVLDAFNGKVDAILGRVRHNNFGTLNQEIKDVFSLVNFNGKAFREARVNEEFLDARLEELKWAQAVQELRLRQKEEQRAIGEQIREEAKAQRELDSALKQAQRDEDLLSRALEKARQEYENASAEDRTKYERHLEEITNKLKEAEERNRRALSMAQQTKCGHVYVISNVGSFGEQVYKIGLTRRLEPLDRVKELGDASVPFPFDVHAMIYSEDAPSLENALHKRFLANQVNKVNRRKEFFRVDVRDIRKIVEDMKFEVKWTLAAEAHAYRETLALERQMQEDPAFRERWLEHQQATPPPARRFDEDVEDTSEEPDGELVAAGVPAESSEKL